MKKFLSFFAFAALALSMAACSDDSGEPVKPGDDTPADVTLQTGKYNFMAAEYVDNNGNVVAAEYNTFEVIKNIDGTYSVSGLMNSSVVWNATYNEESSQLILDGSGYIETEEGKDTNNGQSWFFIATDPFQLSETEFIVCAMLSFESIEEFNNPNGNPYFPCALNVDPKTGKLESFETFLVFYAFMFDINTYEIGDSYGPMYYALPGTEIMEGVAEHEYIEYSKGPKSIKSVF